MLDILKKTKKIKRKFPVLFSVGVFLLLIIVINLIRGQASTSDKIGVIPIEGIILKSDTIINQLHQMEERDDVVAIVIHINSPGGTIVSAQELYSEIRRITKHKKVYASLSNIAASGGYYVAAATDKIFANAGTITGSIGVIFQSLQFNELLQKIGIKVKTVKSGEYKDIFSSYRDTTKKEQEIIQRLINSGLQQFINDIAANRPISREKVAQLADGRIFDGTQAHHHKLIDEVQGFQNAIHSIKNELKLPASTSLVYPEKTLDDFSALFMNKFNDILSIREDFSGGKLMALFY